MTNIISATNIQSKIYTIRGVQVMLDRDLAILYEVKAIRLREQIKRNKKRFPADFMFRLTKTEADFMVSQNAIPSKKHLGGSLPYVFTEQGVVMLSSVLKSEIAVKMSILEKLKQAWFVYIVECQDGTYYTGVTNNIEHRIKQHNLGKGAKYTRARLPVSLVYSEKCSDRSAALKRECAIKKLTRAQKKALI